MQQQPAQSMTADETRHTNAQIFQNTQGDKYGNYDSDDDVQVEEVEYEVETAGSSSSKIADNPDLDSKEEMPAQHRPTVAWKRSANEARLLQRGAPLGEAVRMSVSGTGAVSVSDSPALPTGDPGDV